MFCKMQQYRIKIVGNAPKDFPTETLFGLLYYGKDDNEVLDIPQHFPFKGEWGKPTDVQILNRDEYPMPYRLEIVWLSIVEKKFYEVMVDLPVEELEMLWSVTDQVTGEPLYDTIVVGMAPKGYIALWFNGTKKSVLAGWFQGKETTVPMKMFIPNHPDITVNYYCDNYLPTLFDGSMPNIPSLLSQASFDKDKQTFMYRYLLLFGKWDEENEHWIEIEADRKNPPEFDYIEESLYDATYDKLHDGGLLKYHEAGKPKKLALAWHIKKSEYTAYFWFEDERIREVFDRFYGAHPDTKTDFIIRIDPEKRKYELALYRYGLKEPYTIPEDAYQILVFKNKFEDYRSENYSQERGAWIW